MSRLALVLVAALAVTGCGSDGRKEAVKSAESWLRAVSERDAERACELMHESAVDTIRKKSELDPDTACPGAIRVYADAFEPKDLDSILKVGLEAEGTVKKNELGVFPRSGPRELQVILMRRQYGEWKVASMSLGPGKPPAKD